MDIVHTRRVKANFGESYIVICDSGGRLLCLHSSVKHTPHQICHHKLYHPKIFYHLFISLHRFLFAASSIRRFIHRLRFSGNPHRWNAINAFSVEWENVRTTNFTYEKIGIDLNALPKCQRPQHDKDDAVAAKGSMFVCLIEMRFFILR